MPLTMVALLLRTVPVDSVSRNVAAPALSTKVSRNGVSNGADLRALQGTGAAAVISGRALLEDLIPAQELAPFLPGA